MSSWMSWMIVVLIVAVLLYAIFSVYLKKPMGMLHCRCFSCRSGDLISAFNWIIKQLGWNRLIKDYKPFF